MKKITLIIVLISTALFAQVNIKSIEEKGASFIFTLENNISYSINMVNKIATMKFNDFFDESKEGEAIFLKQDLFIAIPPNSKTTLSYEIVKSKFHKALPEFNPEIELNEKKEIIYKDISLPKKTEYHFIKNKGYLWLNNNYSIHIQISPFEYLGSKGGIDEIVQYRLVLKFTNNSLEMLDEKLESVVHSLILNKNIATKYQSTPNFEVNNNDSWIDYSKQYLKIGTAIDGIYRIKKNNIEEFGIDIASINPKSFKLFLKGEEIPIYVEGESDFSFDSDDYLEFVGIRNMGEKHRELSGYDQPYNEYLGRYTDTTIYWLTWDGIDGERVEISDGNEVSSNDTLDYYSHVEHYEKNNWFDFSTPSLVRRELPFWIENKTWIDGGLGVGVKNKSFTVSNLKLGEEAKLFVKLQDWVSNISINAHLFALSINSYPDLYDSTYVNKYEKAILQTEISSNLLIEGTNTLKIHVFETDATVNNSFLDWYEIEYPRYLIPIDESLNFIFPFIENPKVSNVKLQNITSNNFSLWKYGETFKKYNLSSVNAEIIFADTISANTKFTYMDESKIKTPKIYYAKQFVNLRSSENKADYIAITHKKFKTKVDEYAQFISDSYTLETKVIDIDDIYDEYSYGFFNPEVIKDFLKSTHNNWQSPKPQSVFLIGGATYDYYGNKYKNHSAITKRVLNYVPSYGASVSDNWYVMWDTTGAYIPQMDIGRLPVTTNEELGWYFEKHQNYLSQEYDYWNKNYIFFTGGNLSKLSEVKALRESNQYVIDNYVNPKPIGGNAHHLYKTENPATNFGPYSPEYIQSVIDNGGIFISYLGHSGTQTWDNSIVNAAQLKNSRNRSPLITDYGCSTARFAEPDVVSFSQSFTIGSDGQALAYIGNSSLGFLSTALAMPRFFYKKILKENIHNVSIAHKEAKLEILQTYGSSGVYELFSLTNTLIGDPVLTLPIPKKPNFVVKEEGIQIASDLLTDLQDSTEVTIKLNNYGSAELDTLLLLTIHQFQTETDSIYSRLEIPNFADSINIKLYIKNRAGNHSVKVILDPNNKYEEISKDDNIVQINFNVASSSIRPLFNTQILNGLKKHIEFLNPTSRPMNETIIFDISSNSSFNNPESYNIFFDSLFSVFDIGDLNNGERFWGRTKIKGDNNYTTNFSFITNSEKYFLFDSLSIDKTTLHDIYFSEKFLSINTSKIKFSVTSAGFNDGNFAHIKKDDFNYVPLNVRGHHVALFDMQTYEFKQLLTFDVLSDENERNRYITFLDTLSSDYLVCISIADEGTPRSAELVTKIKSLGSVLIDNVGWRASWAFIGYKGATPGTMPEAYSPSGQGPVTIDTTISFLSDSGTMLTSEIGPTGKWDKLVVSQEIPSNSAITYTPIGIKADGTLDTLSALTLVDSVADLNHINSDLYPKIKILADFTASDDKQSPVLKSLGVDYNDVAELAMNYQVVSVESDSIIQGEKNKLTFYIYNVGETNADSVSVKIELQKSDNSSIILDEFVTSVNSTNKKKFELEYKIIESYGYGDMAFSITVDEDEKITEFFKDNNYYQIPFYVKKDTTTNINSAEIYVKFDGFEIMDGDFVADSPQILFELNYSGNFPLEDTSAIRFTLDNTQVYNSQMNIDYDTVNRTVTYIYEPKLDDGQHYLKVTSNHLLIDDNFGIDKLFTVSNELKALDIYNFPNPASEVTDFTFRLAKVPEELDIKIYTVAGRLIKTFELQSYDLKADINKLHWDLTDQDGDKIANGVYLYKIILRDQDKVEHYTQKLAVVR
ncbi:MAG: C25 family cysteine peptidase [Flavobacteriaceae bacterium]|nr:C25 family cysteine peptidase [Flavobacteriaceae bacterium]